jgi:hypothetical protein
VLALVERAARFPEGLALLEGGLLECVAVLLGVEPRTLERARAALADPALRAEAGRHHLRLTGGRRTAPAAPSPEPPPPPRDPQALLLAALAREGGVALLLSAAPEAAAVAFGVHPALVHRAREAAGPVPTAEEVAPRPTSAPA